MSRSIWRGLGLALLGVLWAGPLLAQTAQVVEYYHTDARGSVRAVTKAGAVVSRHDFMPFGEEIQPTIPPPEKRLFFGKERDFEAALDYLGARYLANPLARFTTVDPITISPVRLVDPQQLNLYAYAKNNPLRFYDPHGLSTHTDAFGDVLVVYDDGDVGIYRHNISNWDGSFLSNKGDGVSWMGETWLWDEFVAHDMNTGKPLDHLEQGARIMFGASWVDDLSNMESMAELTFSPGLFLGSLPYGLFDIKRNSVLAPFGAATGKLLFGKYATAESAGNFLAGYNAARKGWSQETIMQAAGGVHRGGFTGAVLGLFGREYGRAPFYGEIPYAGYYILMGINNGRR
jgi:RHS repeat-associated protein